MRGIPYICLVVCLLCTGVARSQPVDETLTRFERLASFDEARSLAIDLNNRIYVVDGGNSIIYRMDPDGVILDEMGGRGSGDYDFDDPRDVDPTNGLLLVVADAGNSRLVRYSGDYRYLGSLSTGRSGTGLRGSAGLGQRHDPGDLHDVADARPIAVAVSSTGDIFALDERQRAVFKWNRSYRIERVFGGYDSAAGTLIDPVDLTVGRDGNVYVADRGHASIMVYDAFGSYRYDLGSGQLSEIRAVSAQENRLLAVLPDRLLVYDQRGMLEQVLAVDVDESLVDAGWAGGTLYLLTGSRLLRVVM